MVNIRNLIRARTKGTFKEIRSYLKFISLCNVEHREINFDVNPKDLTLLDSYITHLVKESKSKYLSISIKGGTERGSSSIIVNILKRMKELDVNFFFHTIKCTPQIKLMDIHRLAYEGLEAVTKKTLLDARSFCTHLNIERQYFYGNNQSSLIYPCTANTIKHDLRNIHLFADSATITADDNIVLIADSARHRDVELAKGKAGEYFFDFKGICGKEYERKRTELDIVTHEPIKNLGPFLDMVIENEVFFNKGDKQQVKFTKEFCPKLQYIANGSLGVIEKLEASQGIKTIFLKNQYTIQRGSTNPFDSPILTKLLIYQEITLHKQEEIRDILHLFEEIFGKWETNELEIDKNKINCVHQFNKLLSFFEAQEAQDFKQFIDEQVPYQNFRRLYRQIDPENSQQIGFDEPIGKFLVYIYDDRHNYEIAARIVQESCLKENIQYRIQRMNLLFQAPIPRWHETLKYIIIAMNLDNEKESELLQLYMESDETTLQNPNAAFLSKIDDFITKHHPPVEYRTSDETTPNPKKGSPSILPFSPSGDNSN